jgi:hypothetical protein
MLRYLRRAVLIGALLLAASAALAIVESKEESLLAVLYETVFGSPDLGPVEFETLARRQTPNDALACPAGFCAARADFDPGVYPFGDEELRRRFAAVVLAEPRVVPLYRSDTPGRPVQDRYLQRTRWLSFPDTIDVRFIAIDDSRSTLAIYSRSQIGVGDLGVNLARIRLWADPARLGAAGG